MLTGENNKLRSQSVLVSLQIFKRVGLFSPSRNHGSTLSIHMLDFNQVRPIWSHL